MKKLLITLLAMGMVLLGCGKDEETPDSDSANGTENTGVAVGQAAPLFTLPTATGDSVSLADYLGRPVLLYFHMAVG